MDEENVEMVPQQNRQGPSYKAQEVIRQVEANKATLLATPGKYDQVDQLATVNATAMQLTAMQHSSVVDKRYVVIGTHIDETLKDKIRRSDYVDFARLLPRDRPSYDDNRLEIVSRGGQTFFVPAGERDSANLIGSFQRWEQAFRIYSNIYLQAHPQKATELLQYNHVIFTASLAYVWDNVYTYDKEFRSHLALYPNRSWSIILQQAWSMCLTDKISHFGNGKFNSSTPKSRKEICKHFNKGLCTAGHACKYDHRCLECGKFRHGMHICRKRLLNQGQGTSKSKTGGAVATSLTLNSTPPIANRK